MLIRFARVIRFFKKVFKLRSNRFEKPRELTFILRSEEIQRMISCRHRHIGRIG